MTKPKKRLKTLFQLLKSEGFNFALKVHGKHSASLKCKQGLRGYRLFDYIYLDRDDCYDKPGNCPIKFNLDEQFDSKQVKNLLKQIKYILGAEGYEFSNQFNNF